MSIADIRNHETGHPFRMRLVRAGDRYGKDMGLTHGRDDPLVEFYDAEHDFEVDPDGAQLGQFVSRYRLSTLLGEDGFTKDSVFEAGRGLNLDAGVPQWSIDGAGMDEVREALVRMDALEAGPDDACEAGPA